MLFYAFDKWTFEVLKEFPKVCLFETLETSYASFHCLFLYLCRQPFAVQIDLQFILQKSVLWYNCIGIFALIDALLQNFALFLYLFELLLVELLRQKTIKASFGSLLQTYFCHFSPKSN